jgi:putative transposase
VEGLEVAHGRDRVRHGHGPHRAIQTGVGPVEVRRAKVRDRGDVGAAEKIRFTSSILRKWARRTKSLDALLPVLYLRGVSTGDFQEVLTALLGREAPNLSPAVITRLTAEFVAPAVGKVQPYTVEMPGKPVGAFTVRSLPGQASL